MNQTAEIILSERQYLIHILKKLTSRQWQYSTLCEGWAIEDLAAHLIVRERGNPLARAGIVLPFLHQFHDSAILKKKAQGHEEMIKQLASPPRWVPRLSFNIIEFFVHNEDVLRGQLNQQRNLDEELEIALAGFIPALSRFAFRRLKVAINITLKDERTLEEYVHHCGPMVGRTALELEILGRSGELVLLLNGRGSSAKVKVSGSPQALEAYRLSDIGM